MIVHNPVVGKFYNLRASSGDIKEVLDWDKMNIDIDNFDGSKYLKNSVVKIVRATATELVVDIYEKDDLILSKSNMKVDMDYVAELSGASSGALKRKKSKRSKRSKKSKRSKRSKKSMKRKKSTKRKKSKKRKKRKKSKRTAR